MKVGSEVLKSDATVALLKIIYTPPMLPIALTSFVDPSHLLNSEQRSYSQSLDSQPNYILLSFEDRIMLLKMAAFLAQPMMPSVLGPENQEFVLKIRCAQLGQGVELGRRLLYRSASCLQDGLYQELSHQKVLM
jgi:hypothetical protein